MLWKEFLPSNWVIGSVAVSTVLSTVMSEIDSLGGGGGGGEDVTRDGGKGLIWKPEERKQLGIPENK